jgi:DNA-binding MarR family transcriptional regulator
VNDIASPPRPAAPPGLDPAGAQAAAADLLTAMSALRRTTRRTVGLAWEQEPLSPAQSELLRLTAARPRISVADAAQELRLAPNTVSTLVGRLTDAGLLSRERSARDGRAALLTITEKAARRLAEFRDLRAELAGRALARLSSGDQQVLAAAGPALLRLAERMEVS